MKNKLIVGSCIVAAFLIGGWVGQTTSFITSTPVVQAPNHPIAAYGSDDYEVLIETLGEQVRLTEELSALQEQKIRKLQQQVEILDNAGLRACDYLQRIVIDLAALQQGLKAASLAELDIEKLREMLITLRTNVIEAGKDVSTIFLSSPVYHVNTGVEE